jgi:hypothetical protein
MKRELKSYPSKKIMTTSEEIYNFEENKTNNIAGQSEPCIIGGKETPDDHKEGAN